MNRTGKIALLPCPLRDELNRRLEQNVPGRVLTAWLNSLPEVQAILATYFHGDPINQQNLSNWRRGGFAEWQARQDFFDGLRHLAEDAADIEATLGPIADQAARMAALQFALLLDPSRAIRGTTSTSTAAPGHAPAPSFTSEAIKSLCQITRAIATLRRGDLAAARFKHQVHEDQKQDRKRKETPASASRGELPNANTVAQNPSTQILPFAPPARESNELAALNPASGSPAAAPPEPEIKPHQANSSPLHSLPVPPAYPDRSALGNTSLPHFAPGPLSAFRNKWLFDRPKSQIVEHKS